jgi:hypothetical protein
MNLVPVAAVTQQLPIAEQKDTLKVWLHASCTEFRMERFDQVEQPPASGMPSVSAPPLHVDNPSFRRRYDSSDAPASFHAHSSFEGDSFGLFVRHF